MTDRIFTPDGDRRRSLFDRKAEFGLRSRETGTVPRTSARGAISHALAPAGARDPHDPAAGKTRTRPGTRAEPALAPPSRTGTGAGTPVLETSPPPRAATRTTPDESPAAAGAVPVRIAGAAGLGALVRERRARRGLTQQQVADLAGLGRRFVSELEAGKTTLEFDRVVQCCAALGIDLVARSRS